MSTEAGLARTARARAARTGKKHERWVGELRAAGWSCVRVDDDVLLAATRAIHDVDCDAGPACVETMTTYGRYGRYAAAALAVLGEVKPDA